MKTGLRRLHYFLMLSEHLNYRRTAAELGMTQPALSRAIQQLEDELGFALFERSTRQVKVTEAGDVFEKGCREALGKLAQSEIHARKIAKGDTGRLIIGYTEIAIAGKLAQLVDSFRKARPQVEVELRAAWSEAQSDLLTSGAIDVGFMTGPIEHSEFTSLCVQSDPLVAVMPHGHKLAMASTVDLRDLARQPFVTGSKDRWRVFHRHVFRICASAGFEPRIVQTAPDTLSILGLVACGMGVSIQTDNPQIQTDARIAARPIRGSDDRIRTYAVWKAGQTNSVGLAFIDHIQAWRIED